jgi:plastocyanin
MRLDKLPVGEAIIGFLLVALVAAFIVAKSEVDPKESEAGESPTASAAPSGSSAPGQLEITMTDNKFDQTSLTVKAGADVSIPLTNHGVAIHNVHVSDESGNFAETFCTGSGGPCSDPARLNAGATGTLAFTAPAAGTTLKFRCDYHPTEMTGTITSQ